MCHLFYFGVVNRRRKFCIKGKTAKAGVLPAEVFKFIMLQVLLGLRLQKIISLQA
jgi:hypothetical protein